MIELTGVKMKKCTKCEEIKEPTAFSSEKKNSDGLQYHCKTCVKAYQEENKECIKIYQEAYKKTEAGKASQRKSDEKRRLEHPEKIKARNVLNHAIEAGKMSRQVCSICGKKEAQAHHDDYLKPLEVKWLCIEHHNEERIKNPDEK